MRNILIVLWCLLLAGCTTMSLNKDAGEKLFKDAGFALDVKNLWLSQSIKGKKEIFTNDVEQIFYYVIFQDFQNIGYFMARVFDVEWIDPAGEIYQRNHVATSYGNNNLVTANLRLKDSMAAEKLGLWKVKFFRDGVFLSENSFMLESPGVRQKRLAEIQKLQQERQVVSIHETFDSQKGVVVEINKIQSITKIVNDNNPYVALLIILDSDGEKIATGSGFLVGSNGLLATNYHVIENVVMGGVKFSDDAIHMIKEVVAVDEDNDLALVRIDYDNKGYVGLGNSDVLQVGEQAIAIGSPLALANSVSEGIISARRNLPGQRDLLQITTPISPGSSRGPLFNATGNVIGVTTSSISKGSAQSINFAVPINLLKDLISQPYQIRHLMEDEDLLRKYQGYRELKK